MLSMQLFIVQQSVQGRDFTANTDIRSLTGTEKELTQTCQQSQLRTLTLAQEDMGQMLLHRDSDDSFHVATIDSDMCCSCRNPKLNIYLNSTNQDQLHKYQYMTYPFVYIFFLFFLHFFVNPFLSYCCYCFWFGTHLRINVLLHVKFIWGPLLFKGGRKKISR